MSDITPGQAIDQASQEIAPNDEEFRRIMHAIAMAESGGNPNAVGDGGVSIGLFQNNMAAGRGYGHTKENLLNPLYNARLSAKELFRVYQQGVAAGLKGQQLVAYVSRYGQRPAAGLEWNAAKHYGEYVAGSKTKAQQEQVKDYTNLDMIPNQNKTTPYEDFIKRYLTPWSKVQAAEPTGLMMSSVNPVTNTYTVRPGDTLWGIAQQYYGNGNMWNQLQGYSGDPTKLPVGTQISVPRQTVSTTTQNYTPAASKPAVYSTPTPTPVPTPTPKPAPVQSTASTYTAPKVYPNTINVNGTTKIKQYDANTGQYYYI